LKFLWTDENIEHINTRHNVSSDEVEEVFYNKPLYQISNSQPDTPKRYLAFGKTDAGRYLVIVFVRMKTLLSILLYSVVGRDHAHYLSAIQPAQLVH